jgi:GNAT superfamily N-acetyltransferase
MIVRPATGPPDIAFIATAVGQLVGELRGTGPVEIPHALATAEALATGTVDGIALIAQDDTGERVGMATASYQSAIRTGGRYSLIQELWVAGPRRGRGVGRALIAELGRHSAAEGCTVLEVCLPGPRSPVFSGTRASYLSWGFAELGPRMRKALDVAGR